MEFSSRIAAIRKDLHMSQEKFGELVNVSQRTVAAWESGDRRPSLAVLNDLSVALGVSVDFLLGKTEAKNEKQPTADGELLDETIRRVRTLPEPALARVQDFLDGLEAGLSIGPAVQADPDPGSESAG